MSKEIEEFNQLERECKNFDNELLKSKTRLVERQNMLKEKLDQIKDEFGIDPNNIAVELEKLRASISEDMGNLQKLLNQVTKPSGGVGNEN